MPNLEDIGELPEHIIDEYLEVSLYIDVMHVNEIMFLVSVLKHIWVDSMRVYLKEESREVPVGNLTDDQSL